MNKSNIKRWVKALRSGKYEQTTDRLQDNTGYCCLGVACKLFIPKNKQLINEDGGVLYGDIPEDQLEVPLWLNYVNDNFYEQAGVGLDVLNDDGLEQYAANKLDTVTVDPLNFDEIADLLEAVYLYEVLK